MIEKIELKNFQAHKDSDLEFIDGLNCIVGDSDSGKTSILRAIRWVLHNRPTGLTLINRNAKEAQVDIKVNGHNITKIRNKTTNSYKIGDISFDMVGREVPDEVSTAFNVSELNIQRQMDSPFLVFSPPGQVASVLNACIGFDVADKIISNILSDLREYNSNIKTQKQIAKDNQDKVDSILVWFPDFEVSYLELKEVTEKIKDQDVKITTIRAILDDLDTLYTQTDRLVERYDTKKAIQTKIEGFIGQIETLDQPIITLETKISTIATYIDDLEKLEDKIASLTQTLTAKQKKYELIQKGMKLVEKGFDAEIGELESKIKVLGGLLVDIGNYSNQEDSLNQKLKEVKTKKKKVLAELSKFNECPLCGSELDEKAKTKVFKEYGL